MRTLSTASFLTLTEVAMRRIASPRSGVDSSSGSMNPRTLLERSLPQNASEYSRKTLIVASSTAPSHS